ncbi:hypothetical protein [Arthrobacter sp. UYCo732]|uniref:hypothetical protein n=1 Tax=Arthrobacter sp. UYCo732 TaxID=3156336 RepID=UPI0033969D16
MERWPFGERGGMSVAAFSSDDPLICAHQAVRLQILLRMCAGRYEETCMILNRLEIVYLCAGRREDADRVHADKIKLAPPASGDFGDGFFDRIRWWWDVRRTEARFQRGQLLVDEHLADLQRRAPWKSGQDADAVWGML